MNMTLGAWFVVIPTICYAGAAIVNVWNRDWPLVAVYSGYAFANCGLIVMAK